MPSSSSAVELWSEQLLHNRLPRWHELPEIELYMDQVVLLVEKYLGLYMPGDEKFITAAMINNYVKNRLLPPPNKKRYGREHLARLISLCLLKQALPIADIRALLSGADENSLPQMYDRLCDGQEKAFAFAVKACRENPEMLTGSAALNMALLACASKTMSQRMLEAAPAEPEAK